MQSKKRRKKGKHHLSIFSTLLQDRAWKKGKEKHIREKFSIGFSLSQITSGVRIEIIADQEGDCNFPDSRIGFGGGGSEFENACENGASWGAENGDKNIKAFGYIFVQ